MSRDPALVAVNCAGCGAGLDVLGGGRVVVHVCPYCGSALDAVDGYKLLQREARRPRPETPLTIGGTVHLWGQDFTIIGVLGYRERYGAETYHWVDHQIYSPTHGYAWITLEQGHVTVTRRLRTMAWMSERKVENSKHRPAIWVRGERARYYETSTAEIMSVMGAFTWLPRVGDKTTTISAMSASAMIGFSQGATEREVERTTLLTHDEAVAALGLPDLPKGKGFHPLTPFRRGRNFDFLIWASGLCAALCLVLAVWLDTARRGDVLIPGQRIALTEMPIEFSFDITNAGQLARLDLSGTLNNAWAYVDLELYDPDDVPMFAAGRTLEFYTGRDDEGSWTEGSRSGHVNFWLPQAGTYTLALEVSEAGQWVGPGSDGRIEKLSAVGLELRGNRSAPKWLGLLAVGFGLVMAVPLLRAWWHRKRRWRGSDWTDDG